MVRDRISDSYFTNRSLSTMDKNTSEKGLFRLYVYLSFWIVYD